MRRTSTMFLAILSAALVPSHVAAKSRQAQVEAWPISKLNTASGVEISYRILGPREGKPMLLLAGTGMQLIEWPDTLLDGLVKQGFRVIVYDHRDAGGSTHFSKHGMPDWGAVFAAVGAGKTPPLAYTADAMAQDALELLDALDVRRAHLLGLSGGATVAQLVALRSPARVGSLSLIAANSGNPAIPMPAIPARLASVPQPEAGWGAEALIDRQVAVSRALAGSGSSFDEIRARRLAERTVARDADPLGFIRQGAALIVLGDLRARQSKITQPTLVIHGEDDPLISIQSGREVADAIPGATFLSLPGMGHDLPTNLTAKMLEAIGKNTRR